MFSINKSGPPDLQGLAANLGVLIVVIKVISQLYSLFQETRVKQGEHDQRVASLEARMSHLETAHTDTPIVGDPAHAIK